MCFSILGMLVQRYVPLDRPVPLKYQPFIKFGFYVDEHSLVNETDTVTKAWTPFLREMTFQQDNKRIFEDFDVEQYWVDNVYLREKLANVLEGTNFSNVDNWAYTHQILMYPA